MNFFSKLMISILFLPIIACAVGENNEPATDPITEPTTDPTAEPIETMKTLLLLNGAIYTVNPEQPWAEAIYVEDGQIGYVGTNAAAQEFASEETEIIDLQQSMVLPGLHDIHMHPLEAASPFAGTCLLDSGVEGAEAFIPLLKACAPNQIATDWVLGFGHSVYTLLESERLPIDILDEAIPDQPAVIMEETSHSIWVNSRALALAGIDATTPNPPGGVIVKDTNGELTGVLFDSAGDLIMDLAWQPTERIKQLNYEGLLDALAQVNENGITSVGDGRTYWRRAFQDAWLRAEREETLGVRAVLGLWAYPSAEDEEQLAAIKALYRNQPDDLLRISQVKVYSDGILINTTAAMHDPYLETLGEIPSNNGLNYFTPERLARYIAELDPLGFDFHIHAIGDRGIYEALNAIESSQSGNQRHRLTHLEVVDPADYARFQQLDVTADMQVAGHFTQPAEWAENEFLIGNRFSPLVPLRDLYDAGARVTLSSDWDVSTLNPFVGIQNALTRDPQALPTLEAAIAAYTINPAYALHQEDLVGSIEVGKYADLTVVDQNLFEIPSTQINQTQVLMTFLAGEIVYDVDE